jgi:hypothetical protein
MSLRDRRARVGLALLVVLACVVGLVAYVVSGSHGGEHGVLGMGSRSEAGPSADDGVPIGGSRSRGSDAAVPYRDMTPMRPLDAGRPPPPEPPSSEIMDDSPLGDLFLAASERCGKTADDGIGFLARVRPDGRLADVELRLHVSPSYDACLRRALDGLETGLRPTGEHWVTVRRENGELLVYQHYDPIATRAEIGWPARHSEVIDGCFVRGDFDCVLLAHRSHPAMTLTARRAVLAVLARRGELEAMRAELARPGGLPGMLDDFRAWVEAVDAGDSPGPVPSPEIVQTSRRPSEGERTPEPRERLPEHTP